MVKEFTTRNGIRMVQCNPLNWIVYYSESNPSEIDLYVIDVGSISDMWQCSLRPSTMILSFTSCHYSKDEAYRFKVDSIQEASELVKKFAIGMGQWGNMQHTIFIKKIV